MRVLVWSELFWPYIGGPEVLLAKLIPALRDRGHEFVVLTSHDHLDLPDEERYDGIPVRRLPLRSAIANRDLDLLRDVRQQVIDVKRAFAPDLVHVSAIGPSVFFHLRTLEAGPVTSLVGVQTLFPATEAARNGSLVREVMLSATWVAAVSRAVLAQARRLAPEIARRSSVIPNGFDLGVARSTERRPPEAPRLLCLGRLVRAKGFDVALAAFAMLGGRFPGLRLVIAGDGPARRELERQAEELGVEGAVDFLGWVDPDAVPDIFGTATVVVMPSRREGLPIAAVEAALMGRPIVASRAGGLPEVVVHGRTGLLVEREDPRGLAEAVASLLDRPDTAARMGRAGARRARDVLSLDRCVDAYDTLYRMLNGRYPWSH
jgi:glycogen synthase